MSHNERCKECKVRIRELLERSYGPVVPNYRIHLGTRPDAFQDHPRQAALNEIYSALQNHRGFDEFVKAGYVDVDFFLPEQHRIVEFDESQHFTEARRLALSRYPSALALGFPRDTWMDHCDQIRARDNDPPFRDEQRAWFDTLRDFLPELKGYRPTVRLFARDMAWCSLDVNDPDDLQTFRNIVEGKTGVDDMDTIDGLRQMPNQDWVGTVILQSNVEVADEKHPRNNPMRIAELDQILRVLVERTSGDGVILFPGGWVHTQYEPAETIYPELERCVTEVLSGTARDLKVCIGIDGFFNRENGDDPYDQDQMALTVDRTGIIAIARKFHPTDDVERRNIILAKNHVDGELGFPRIFELNGVRYFPFVCYDVYGPKRDLQQFPKPDVDVGLNLIHRFRPKGDGLSQENYFPVNGWSEASFEWDIPIFGTSIFFRRQIPSSWPSGIAWTSGPVWKKLKYPEIALPHDEPAITIPLAEGSAEVRLFRDIPGSIQRLKEANSALAEQRATAPMPSGTPRQDAMTPVSGPRRIPSGRPPNYIPEDKPFRPVFKAVLQEFASAVPPSYRMLYSSSPGNCRVVSRELPDGVIYEFDDWHEEGRISVEINVDSSRAPEFEPVLRDLESQRKNDVPRASLQPQKPWLRLQIFYSEDSSPEIISGAMRNLIYQTEQSFIS